MTELQKVLYLTFFLLLASWFYWYQYRPSQIRSRCTQESIERVDQKYRNAYVNFQIKMREEYYIQCLTENGINK